MVDCSGAVAASGAGRSGSTVEVPMTATEPEDRADLIEEHLVLCVACKRYLDQYKATVGALPAAVEDEPVSDDARTALLAAFKDWKGAR